MGNMEEKIKEVELMQSWKDSSRIVQCYNTTESSCFELDYMIVVTFTEIDLIHYSYYSDIDCMYYIFDSLTK